MYLVTTSTSNPFGLYQRDVWDWQSGTPERTGKGLPVVMVAQSYLSALLNQVTTGKMEEMQLLEHLPPQAQCVTHSLLLVMKVQKTLSS